MKKIMTSVALLGIPDTTLARPPSFKDDRNAILIQFIGAID